MTEESDDEFMSTSEAADMLGCSTGTVRRLIDDDEIPAFRCAGRWVLHVDDVEAFQEAAEDDGADDDDEVGDGGDEDGDEDEDGEERAELIDDVERYIDGFQHGFTNGYAIGLDAVLGGGGDDDDVGEAGASGEAGKGA